MEWLKKLSIKQIRMLFMGVIILLFAILYAEIVEDVFSEPKIGDYKALIFDKNILSLLKNSRTVSLNQSMIDITALGSFSVIFLIITVLISALIVHKDKRGLFYMFIISMGPAIIPEFLKNFYLRPRPDALDRLANVHSSSFPSGHSFGATVAYLSMAFLISREVKNIKLEIFYYALAFLVIGMVGFSRMYLGAHYPTDVLAGISLGVIWFSLVSLPFIYYSKSQ